MPVIYTSPYNGDLGRGVQGFLDAFNQQREMKMAQQQHAAQLDFQRVRTQALQQEIEREEMERQAVADFRAAMQGRDPNVEAVQNYLQSEDPEGSSVAAYNALPDEVRVAETRRLLPIAEQQMEAELLQGSLARMAELEKAGILPEGATEIAAGSVEREGVTRKQLEQQIHVALARHAQTQAKVKIATDKIGRLDAFIQAEGAVDNPEVAQHRAMIDAIMETSPDRVDLVEQEIRSARKAIVYQDPEMVREIVEENLPPETAAALALAEELNQAVMESGRPWSEFMAQVGALARGMASGKNGAPAARDVPPAVNAAGEEAAVQPPERKFPAEMGIEEAVGAAAREGAKRPMRSLSKMDLDEKKAASTELLAFAESLPKDITDEQFKRAMMVQARQLGIRATWKELWDDLSAAEKLGLPFMTPPEEGGAGQRAGARPWGGYGQRIDG